MDSVENKGVEGKVDQISVSTVAGDVLNRFPLQDCTNQQQQGIEEPCKAKRVNAKGHWKRMPKQTGTEGQGMEIQVPGDSTGTLGKRGRVSLHNGLEIVDDRQNEKKGRLEDIEPEVLISKVGATSREWSQGYK